MRLLSGRVFVAAGVVLMLAGLLVFSFASPHTTVGQETDVPPAPDSGDDVGSGTAGPSEPPASLPDTGSGSYAEQLGSSRLLLITLLGALGLSLAGAGAMATRRTQRVREE
jgi:hypothetical protein